jgi:Putative MetA-pathway of phenol degradation
MMSSITQQQRHRGWKKTAALVSLCASIFMLAAASINAQQAVFPLTDTLPSSSAPEQQSGGEEEEFIKPARPGAANPAEPHKAGVLQVEYGYDANFRAAEFRSQQAAPLALRFAASSRLLLELDLDTVISERDEPEGARMTGIGDTRLGIQAVALKDTEQHPALAFAYYIKLPSASESKGLGTGRVDHKLVTLLSKKVGETDIDFNAAYLIVGREQGSGWISGGQAALSFARDFKSGFGALGEVSWQSKDDTQPRGAYALGALTYQANKRLIFDAGMRFGLNSEAPRVGVFVGVTVGAADFYGGK